MRTFKREEGQTLIETAFVLFLLLLILLGITEFARAWYTKSSIKNAARSGARVAVVTSGITSLPNVQCGSFSCPFTTPPANTNDVIHFVCCSPGVPKNVDTTLDTSVSINLDLGSDSTLNAGDTVTVSATAGFKTIVPGLFRYFIPSQFSAEASMRYE